MKKDLFKICFLICLSLIFSITLRSSTGDRARIDFFAVGQGDATLISLQNDVQILIDGGPSEDILDHLSRSMPFYDKELEVVILSHADADHLTGLVEVIQDYTIKQIYMPAWKHDSQLFLAWERFIQEQSIPVKFVEEKFTVQIQEAEIQFLHPSKQTSEFISINDESIICKVTINQASFLFSGDIEARAEERIVFAYQDALKADILKVPHHGSKTSSTELFIDAVSPELAIIQVGHDNKFHHPHGRVLDRYERKGIRVLRTDQEQSIRLWVDSEGISYDLGMQSFWAWLIGKNRERVYNLGT